MNPRLCDGCGHLDRREFLKIMTLAAVGAALPWQIAHAALDIVGNGSATPVALTGVKKNTAVRLLIEAVKNAARVATDFSWLSKGDTVLIKPALNSGNPYPATTNPAGIMAIIELLKEKGAGRVIVSEMSGVEHVKLTSEKIKGSSRELMKSSGIARAAVEAGAELYFPEEAGWNAFFEDGPADSAHWKNGIMMPKILKEVDHLILMPRCSRHALLGSSLGLKNAVGYWRTDSRLEYHRDAATIQEKTADANTVSSLRDKQRLVLTTATKILATFGPDKGFVAEPETGLIIASESIVAHDMVSLAWLLENRALMSKSQKEDAQDPYQKQFIVTNANRIFVMRLGGIGEAWHAEKLVRHDITSIWDDRVLNRAYQVLGGIPRVNFVEGNDAVSEEAKKKLMQMVSKPA